MAEDKPKFLSSTGLWGSDVHLLQVRSALVNAQKDLFSCSRFPSGVRKPAELAIAVYGMYARAIRDLTQRDSLYGGRVDRSSYTFATNQADLTWMITSGLFNLKAIHAGKQGEIIKTLDGLGFTESGQHLLEFFENDPEFMRHYSRSGIYSRLANLFKDTTQDHLKNVSIELTPPLGLLDPNSAGIVKGNLLAVLEDPRRMVIFPQGGFTIVPSLAVELELTFINTTAVVRLVDTLGSLPYNGKVNQRHLLQKVQLSLDEIFTLTIPQVQHNRKLKAGMLQLYRTD